MSRRGQKRGAPPINEPLRFHRKEKLDVAEEQRFPSALKREDLDIRPLENDIELELRKRIKKKKKHNVRRSGLPNRLFALPNRDKTFHEKWYPERNLLDFPHPFRMVMVSKPNGGKTTSAKHVIMRVGEGKKPFERIFVIHCDGEETLEYEELDAIMLDHIPKPEHFPNDMKTLVILEDLDYLSMAKEQQGCLERLFGYVSTHKNISVMLTAQNVFNVCPAVRRCANIILLWNNHDGDMIKAVARKTGLDPEALNHVLQKRCVNPHDSLWIDFTDNSPMPFRLNGFDPISLTGEKMALGPMLHGGDGGGGGGRVPVPPPGNSGLPVEYFQ